MTKLFKLLFLAISLAAALPAQGAGFQIYSTLTFTNASGPVQSNTVTINTNVVMWRTNATNSASTVLLTNTPGGNCTNLKSDLINFHVAGVTVVGITNGTNLVLMGGVNSNLVVTLVGNYARVSYKTNPVYAAEAAAFPFTMESLASRQLYMNSVLTGLTAYATVPFRMPINIPTGTVDKVILTNVWVGVGGRIGFGTGTPDVDFLGNWGIEATGDGLPGVTDAAGAFTDIVDYVGMGTGIEASPALLTLGSYWRWAPHLGTTADVANFGDRLTNDWYTVNYWHSYSNNFTRHDEPVSFYGSVSMFGGGGTISGIASYAGTNGFFNGTLRVAALVGNITDATNTGTIRGGTITAAAVVDGTLSNMTAIAGTLKASKSQGSFTVESDLSFKCTNFTSLANGNNIAVDFGSNVVVRLAGTLTADASICGIVGGRECKWHRLFNDQPYTVFLAQNTSDPVTTNRFYHKWTAGDLGIPPYGWADIMFDITGLRWTVVQIFPFPTYATNAVASSDGVVTNLHAYPSTSNNVPLVISSAPGQATNVFEFKNSAGAILWSLNASGVPSFAGASVITVLSNGVPISGSVTGLNFVGFTLLTNVNGTVSIAFTGAGSGDVTTAQLNNASNVLYQWTGTVGTNGTNYALAIGLNGTNFTLAQIGNLGTNATNFALALGLNGTNYTLAQIGNLGTNATNFSLTLGFNGTNFTLAQIGNLGTNATNFSLTLGLNGTNYTLAQIGNLGTNATNFSLTIGLNGTNFTLAQIGNLGTNATNFSLTIGLNGTNYVIAQVLPKLNATNGVAYNLTVKSTTTNTVPMTVSSATNATTNSWEVVNNTGKVYTAVGPKGGLHIGGSSDAGESNVVVEANVSVGGNIIGTGTAVAGSEMSLSDTNGRAYALRVPANLMVSLTNVMGPFLFASATNAMLDLNLGNQFVQTNHSTTNITLLLTNPAPWRMYSGRIPASTNGGAAYTVKFDVPSGWSIAWNTNCLASVGTGNVLTNEAGKGIEWHGWSVGQGTSNLVQMVFGRTAF